MIESNGERYMQDSVIIVPRRLKSRVYTTLLPALLYVLQSQGFDISSILLERWGDTIEYAGDHEYRSVLDDLTCDVLDAFAGCTVNQITEIRILDSKGFRIYWS